MTKLLHLLTKEPSTKLKKKGKENQEKLKERKINQNEIKMKIKL